MPEINFKQAKAFLENITSKDKIAIIHHDDLDGFASAIIFYDYCRIKGIISEHYCFTIGKNSLKDYNLKEFNKIIIADLAPNLIIEGIEKIKDKEVFYTDHHPRDREVPEWILEYRTLERGYIPSSRTAYELTGLKDWLALAGTIADVAELYGENDEFIKKLLKSLNLGLEEFKNNITYRLSNFLIYFSKNQDNAFPILEEINSPDEIENLREYYVPVEKEINKYLKEYEIKKEKIGEINFFYFEPKFLIKHQIINMVSRKYLKGIILFITPVIGREGNLSFSTRSPSGNIDLRKILKAGIKGLENSSSGGHRNASGGHIKASDLEKFKENLKDFFTP